MCYSVQDGKMERLREEEEVGRTFIISKLFSFFFFFIIGLMHFLILLLLLPRILFPIFFFNVFLRSLEEKEYLPVFTVSSY